MYQITANLYNVQLLDNVFTDMSVLKILKERVFVSNYTELLPLSICSFCLNPFPDNYKGLTLIINQVNVNFYCFPLDVLVLLNYQMFELP